jgi:hypothetical protein
LGITARNDVIISLGADNMIRTQVSLDEHEYTVAKMEAKSLGLADKARG